MLMVLTLTLLVANFCQYKICKKAEKMGTHLRVLSESFLMSTNMTGFGWFYKNLYICVLWTKEASALEGLISFLGQITTLSENIATRRLVVEELE